MVENRYNTEGNPHSHAKGLIVHSLQPACPEQERLRLIRRKCNTTFSQQLSADVRVIAKTYLLAMTEVSNKKKRSAEPVVADDG